MDLYSRQKSVTVKLTGKDELTAKSWLDDGIHEIVVILVVRHSTSEIISARVEMLHHPWKQCLEAGQTIALIEGMKLGPGIRKEIEDKIGRKTGCFHVADLVIEAIRGIIQGQYRLEYRPTTREGRIKKLHEDMTGSCFAYIDPIKPPDPVGDWIDIDFSPEQYEELQRIIEK